MVVSEHQDVGSCKQRVTQIPVARYGSSVRGKTASTSSEDGSALQDNGVSSAWKHKFEQAELRRKETLNQLLKAVRDKEETERNLTRTTTDLRTAKSQLDHTKRETEKLKSLSEGMVKEYDKLRNKYELETGALQQAMTRATEWYKENRELKRRSAVLMQKVMSVAPSASADIDQTDLPEQSDEIDHLNRQIQGFRSQVAALQAEVNSLKLQEFEAQEQVANLTACLEDERNKVNRLQIELQEEIVKNENLEQATRMAAHEVGALRDQYEKERTQAIQLKSDADQARKERNVLAHQSQILLCEAAQDEKLMKALFEIESLKRALEEQNIKYSDINNKYQEKIAMEEEAPQVELLEGKLKLVESELAISEERARRAENQLSELQLKLDELEERGAIDELINEIKGGRFSLRTPERQKKVETEDKPAALKEMMNVLGTLRRRPGNRSPSFRNTKPPEMKQSTQDITI